MYVQVRAYAYVCVHVHGYVYVYDLCVCICVQNVESMIFSTKPVTLRSAEDVQAFSDFLFYVLGSHARAPGAGRSCSASRFSLGSCGHVHVVMSGVMCSILGHKKHRETIRHMNHTESQHSGTLGNRLCESA